MVAFPILSSVTIAAFGVPAAAWPFASGQPSATRLSNFVEDQLRGFEQVARQRGFLIDAGATAAPDLVRDGGERAEESAREAALPDTDEFVELLRGGFSKEKLLNFFSSRPLLVAQRMGQIGRVFWRVQSAWRSPDLVSERGNVLRKGLCELGPVFIKMGQTLAQREDLVGDEVAEELKKLQVQAEPFPDEEAHTAILFDLDHHGPLAPGICPAGCDPALPPLFRTISDGPVAAASLGQVYRATTFDGRELAVKVQRPNCAAKVALDWTCGTLLASFYRSIVRAYNDFTKVADQVAQGVFLELDYHNEARNMQEFYDKHHWLGYITAPRFVPEYSGPEGTARVLSTEWVKGTPISELPSELQREAVGLPMQAAIVMILLTGFVHADPHEGNLLYTNDGRIAFLDFGLVDRIDPWVMQGFAQGMVAIREKRWADAARAMQAVKWVPDPVMRNLRPGQVGPEYVECAFEEFVEALAEEMENDSRAQRSFGSTAAVVSRLSRNFLVLAPPYVVLLTRTFVTLEGLVARIDPEFNVFEQAVPVTLRRLMSPTTPEGRQALRDSILTNDGEIRWDALEMLLQSTSSDPSHRHSKSEPWAVLNGFLGSSDALSLRRLVYDVDAQKALRYLVSSRGRLWRRRASSWLASRWGRQANTRSASSLLDPREREELENTRHRQAQRQHRAVRLLAGRHIRNLSNTGRMSSTLFLAMVAALLVLRVTGGAAGIVLVRRVRSIGVSLRLAAGGAMILEVMRGVQSRGARRNTWLKRPRAKPSPKTAGDRRQPLRA